VTDAVSIVCYLWSGTHNLSRREFLPRHVNTLSRMVHRHVTIPHRFVCISDTNNGLEHHVEWVQTPAHVRALGTIPTPEGPRFPSCYRRLWSWGEECRAYLGPRQLVIDIDLVITRNIDHILTRDEDFVGWRPYRDWGAKLRYGGGLYLLTTGARQFVFDNFKGVESVKKARDAGYRGSDQAWISYQLCHERDTEEPYYDKAQGLYSVRDLDAKLTLPKDACLVQFNGTTKPWQSPVQWVRDNWK
jgi:hypothetical protein